MNDLYPTHDRLQLDDGDEIAAVLSAHPAALVFTKKGRLFTVIPTGTGTVDVRDVSWRHRK